eukprot:558493-Prymnesium_polylepis.1
MGHAHAGAAPPRLAHHRRPQRGQEQARQGLRPAGRRGAERRPGGPRAPSLAGAGGAGEGLPLGVGQQRGGGAGGLRLLLDVPPRRR